VPNTPATKTFTVAGARQVRLMDLRSFAPSTCVVAALLAGCGGSQPPIGAPGAMPQTSVAAVRAEGDGSWMASDGASQDLLYVTSGDWVDVFSYPAGKLKGVLTKFHSAVGECSDKSGNVFIANQMPPVLYEFAHGGTRPIATLRVPKTAVEPVGCSIDPTTGNLAVVGFSHGVEVFKAARGTPTFYRDKNYYGMQVCAYDGKGNLFVNGFLTLKRSGLLELPKNAKEFLTISTDTPPNPNGGIQWFGSHLAVGGDRSLNSYRPVIYQYSLRGQTASVTGTTPLGSPGYIALQFLIDGGTVIVPNVAKQGPRPYSVLTYSYPKGGKPLSRLIEHLDVPRGVALSHPQTRSCPRPWCMKRPPS
jgi:hypothetical protein